MACWRPRAVSALLGQHISSPWKASPPLRKIYVGGGGLLVAPHLLLSIIRLVAVQVVVFGRTWRSSVWPWWRRCQRGRRHTSCRRCRRLYTTCWCRRSLPQRHSPCSRAAWTCRPASPPASPSTSPSLPVPPRQTPLALAQLLPPFCLLKYNFIDTPWISRTSHAR